MLDFDFIEIGTADFDTEIQKAQEHTRGISIEPLHSRLEALPKPQLCHKICAAVGSKRGYAYLYYVPDRFLKDLPDWARGCSKMGEAHPTIPFDKQDCLQVKVITPEDLYNDYKIGNIGLLKVDTEGMDVEIVSLWIATAEELGRPLPDKIIMECNSLTPEPDKVKILELLDDRNYDVQWDGDNIVAQLINELKFDVLGGLYTFEPSTGKLTHPNQVNTSWFTLRDGEWVVSEWAVTLPDMHAQMILDKING